MGGDTAGSKTAGGRSAAAGRFAAELYDQCDQMRGDGFTRAETLEVLRGCGVDPQQAAHALGRCWPRVPSSWATAP
jgi:hypothetical protein